MKFTEKEEEVIVGRIERCKDLGREIGAKIADFRSSESEALTQEGEVNQDPRWRLAHELALENEVSEMLGRIAGANMIDSVTKGMPEEIIASTISRSTRAMIEGFLDFVLVSVNEEKELHDPVLQGLSACGFDITAVEQAQDGKGGDGNVRSN